MFTAYSREYQPLTIQQIVFANMAHPPKLLGSIIIRANFGIVFALSHEIGNTPQARELR